MHHHHRDRSLLTRTVDAETAAKTHYDLVFIGSGITASILAKEITKAGPYRILIVEAAVGKDMSEAGYQKLVESFYGTLSKDNNALYPENPNARMPRSPEIRPIEKPGEPNTDAGYWVQYGPYSSDSVYSRILGGTTQHWEAKVPRMLRDDFKLKTIYGQGADWPIDLDTLMPYYAKAEFELGVSGETAGQRKLGVEFPAGYEYPMHEMPPTYLDEVVRRRMHGMSVNLDGKDYPLTLETFPQARNGVPNEKYKNCNPVNPGEPFTPVGAVSLFQSEKGQRCQGNTNCVPICPVQAKYDSRRTLADALMTGQVDLLVQAVASQVHFDSSNGRVNAISVKVYGSPQSPEHRTICVRGKIFALCANAVENARLLLASSALSGETRMVSDFVGRNLMDHPFLLAWARLPENAGVGRGPVVTSGICNLRNGSFRKHQAAFAVDIHNDGTGWANGGAGTDAMQAVFDMKKFGTALREELTVRISRQLLLAFMIEMMPEANNRVTVDGRFLDALGNMRPVVHYRIPDYTMAGAAYARTLSKDLFKRMGIPDKDDFTNYPTNDPGYVFYQGQGYALRGGNHLSGTHLMGTAASNSVVDSYQRAWGHQNLFIVGAGSMPTIGTSNTTLTLSAVCYRTAEEMLRDLTSVPSI